MQLFLRPKSSNGVESVYASCHLNVGPYPEQVLYRSQPATSKHSLGPNFSVKRLLTSSSGYIINRISSWLHPDSKTLRPIILWAKSTCSNPLSWPSFSFVYLDVMWTMAESNEDSHSSHSGMSFRLILRRVKVTTPRGTAKKKREKTISVNFIWENVSISVYYKDFFLIILETYRFCKPSRNRHKCTWSSRGHVYPSIETKCWNWFPNMQLSPHCYWFPLFALASLDRCRGRRLLVSKKSDVGSAKLICWNCDGAVEWHLESNRAIDEPNQLFSERYLWKIQFFLPRPAV